LACFCGERVPARSRATAARQPPGRRRYPALIYRHRETRRYRYPTHGHLNRAGSRLRRRCVIHARRSCRPCDYRVGGETSSRSPIRKSHTCARNHISVPVRDFYHQWLGQERAWRGGLRISRNLRHRGRAEFLAPVRLWPEQPSPFTFQRSLGEYHAQQRSPIKSLRPPCPVDIWLDRRGAAHGCAGGRIVLFPAWPARQTNA
jgi:hypothetical protein